MSMSHFIEVGSKTFSDNNNKSKSWEQLVFVQKTASIFLMPGGGDGNGDTSDMKSVEDPLYRYKFFGTKVCEGLGVPENQWIYTDVFRVSNNFSIFDISHGYA